MRRLGSLGSFLAVTFVLGAVAFKGGCGGNDFLGLEGYQRDFLFSGLAFALLQGQGTADPAEGGGDPPAGEAVPGPEGAQGLPGETGTVGATGVEGPQGPEGPAGPIGPAGNAGTQGKPGEGGEQGPAGPAGSTGSTGATGATGPMGPEGAHGSVFFDQFIDDLFTYQDHEYSQLPIRIVSVVEPALGTPEHTAGDAGAIAFRFGIPSTFDAGNDVTMRLFFYRTGPWLEDQCLVFNLDALRLRSGESVAQYGSRIRVRPDLQLRSDTAKGLADVLLGYDGGEGVYMTVDLPINSPNGLDDPTTLHPADMLAFEIATAMRPNLTVWDDGGRYQLLGVEFFESAPGTARLNGAAIFSMEDEVSCGGIAITDCNDNQTDDETDLLTGQSQDCDGNSIPDECDIADCYVEDTSCQDCNGNGIPDGCDLDNGPQGVVAGSPPEMLFPLDGTYQLFDFFNDDHNDDGSGELALPFEFDLYGSSFDLVYVNNNGNLSFGDYFSAYTAEGFPITDYPMVAPFWGDVDTGEESNPIGNVWMKFHDGDSSGAAEALVVTWEDVGYYDERSDKRNTFQVAISDGTNPVMGIGNTVCFSYAQMEWTTGEASDGVNGFGGSPATVGANAGNGVDYFLIGRFDHPGTDYDGPGGAADGVDFLVGQQICFNPSSSTFNIPPIPTNFPPGNELTVAGGVGSLNLQLSMLSPELGQTTTITHEVVVVEGAGDTTGLEIVDSSGNVGSTTVTWTPGCSQAGIYDIVLTATDDFDPPGVTVVTLRIVVSCVTADCNRNGIPDECDVRDGTSEDCQPNGIPDECEEGCVECIYDADCDDGDPCTIDTCVLDSCVLTPGDCP